MKTKKLDPITTLTELTVRLMKKISVNTRIIRSTVVNSDVTSEAVDAFVMAPYTIAKNPDGDLKAGNTMVENVRFGIFQIVAIRYNLTIDSDDPAINVGTMKIYTNKIHTLIRADGAVVHIMHIDHANVNSIDTDGITKVLRKCPINRWIDMDTGDLCTVDGYPLKQA